LSFIYGPFSFHSVLDFFLSACTVIVSQSAEESIKKCVCACVRARARLFRYALVGSGAG
jgi:hypothetical protein